MAYEIIYEPELKSKYPVMRKSKSGRQCIVAFILFCAITVLACQPSVRQILRKFLLPGDPEVTASASKELVQSLKDGGTVRESIMVFCMEIIDGAQR